MNQLSNGEIADKIANEFLVGELAPANHRRLISLIKEALDLKDALHAKEMEIAILALEYYLNQPNYGVAKGSLESLRGKS